MNMISLVEAANVDKSLVIRNKDLKFTAIFTIYFPFYQISYINSTL